MRTRECIPRLMTLGISEYDALALRRASMTLSAWAELECGCDRGAIEKDKAGKWRWHDQQTGKLGAVVPDREKGAIASISKIMTGYPELVPYLQGDCRSAALYVLRRDALRAGEKVDEMYATRGVAVYK